MHTLHAVMWIGQIQQIAIYGGVKWKKKSVENPFYPAFLSLSLTLTQLSFTLLRVFLLYRPNDGSLTLFHLKIDWKRRQERKKNYRLNPFIIHTDAKERIRTYVDSCVCVRSHNHRALRHQNESSHSMGNRSVPSENIHTICVYFVFAAIPCTFVARRVDFWLLFAFIVERLW